MDESIEDGENNDIQRVLSRFVSETGEVAGNVMNFPLNVTVSQLQLICNAVLNQDERVPYIFFVNDLEITDTLGQVLENINTESIIDIVYQQQAVFRVRAVTRCTSSLPGHAEAVISANFSPDGSRVASGSGDQTVRFWDLNTQTPYFTCKGHKNWVLCISWSPNGSKLASGCKNGKIIIWNPMNGKQIGKTLEGHRQWITSICWEPYHRDVSCRRLLSSSKDGDVRIWDSILATTLVTIAGHTRSVTCTRWGGSGFIYTGSQDRMIKVWKDDGLLHKTLEGHAHWINALALNTDYVLRTSFFSPLKKVSDDERQEEALTRYKAICSVNGEILVSGSDDFTLFMWSPETDSKPLARLTGHQQLVNDVKFSPDGRILASASFDKSIKLWDGKTGKFIGTLRGHVQAVYQVAWSADSRLLVSGSADSTLKVWNIAKKHIEMDLPGHADEVYAVDWSPDGSKVVSGGKDKLLRIWQH